MFFGKNSLILLSLALQIVLLVNAGCDKNACANDVYDHQGDYVRCDMCVCDDFGKYAEGSNDDDGGSCSGYDNEYYACYIKSEKDDDTWYCKVRMKTSWIIGIVFIVLVSCCCCAGVCYYFNYKRKPNQPSGAFYSDNNIQSPINRA